jgi:hypothetical protein
MALFTAGNTLTAAQLNALNGYVTKTADQSVTSSTTLVNDTHLLYTIAATGTYVFDVCLIGVSAANAAGDLMTGFTFPTGTMWLSGVGPDPSLASGNAVIGQFGANDAYLSGANFNAYGLSTSKTTINIHGVLTATATGTLRLQWAQQASSASASTLKSGSHMLVRQVA